MKAWIIVGIIFGLMIMTAIVISVTNLVAADATTKANSETTGCSECGNSCTAEKNCGLATCGAVSGKSCGCK